jgi:hypothetical protein
MQMAITTALSNPQFFKCTHFHVELPGQPKILPKVLPFLVSTVQSNLNGSATLDRAELIGRERVKDNLLKHSVFVQNIFPCRITILPPVDFLC